MAGELLEQTVQNQQTGDQPVCRKPADAPGPAPLCTEGTNLAYGPKPVAPAEKPGEKAKPKDEHKGWDVVFNGASYHFAPAKDYNQPSWNQLNLGIGGEYHFNRNSAISFGEMRNSIRNTSAYATYDWTPLHAGPFNFGLMAGAVTGYPENHGGPIPLVLPLATFESKHFGINTLLIPPLGKTTPAVLGLQFKIKIP